MRPWFVLLMLLMAIPAAYAGRHDYFECTDAAGAVSFSLDKCGKGDKQQVIRNDKAPAESITYAAPAVQRTVNTAVTTAQPGAKPTASAAHPNVILYATSWCGYCKKTRELFAEKRIQYVEYDVEKSEEGRHQREKLGGSGVPVLNVNGTIIHGFNRETILSALNLK